MLNFLRLALGSVQQLTRNPLCSLGCRRHAARRVVDSAYQNRKFFNRVVNRVGDGPGHVFRNRRPDGQVTVCQIAHFVHEPQNGLLGIVPVCFCRQALALRFNPSVGLIAVIDPGQAGQSDQGRQTKHQNENDLEVDTRVGLIEALRQFVDALKQFIRILENRDPGALGLNQQLDIAQNPADGVLVAFGKQRKLLQLLLCIVVVTHLRDLLKQVTEGV